MNKLVKICTKTFDRLGTTANTRRFESLKQILTEYTNKLESNLEVNNDTEFRAILKYKSIPIATVKLERTKDKSTFSFEPSISGYLRIHGFSGVLITPHDRDKVDKVELSKKLIRSSERTLEERPFNEWVPFESIPDKLDGIVIEMHEKIRLFLSLVKGIKQIESNIPCTMEEARNDPTIGVFETAGSSRYIQVSLTIEKEIYTSNMKSNYSKQSGKTSRETHDLSVDMINSNIMSEIQSLLLDDCFDKLRKIRTDVLKLTYPMTDSVNIHSGAFTFGHVFIYEDKGHMLDIAIELTYRGEPCILLSIRIDNKQTPEKFYKVSYERIEAIDKKYEYIVMDNIESVHNRWLTPPS